MKESLFVFFLFCLVNFVQNQFVYGFIYTYAGNGSATYYGDGGYSTLACLNFPHAFTFGPNYMWIADVLNHRIRSISLTTGIINTYIGNGQTTMFMTDTYITTASLTVANPYGVVYDSNYLYYNDAYFIIKRVDVNTGYVTIFAGTPGQAGQNGNGGPATSARLSEQRQIVVGSNYLWIAQGAVGNNVRRIHLNTNIITNYAGNTTAGYFGDGGLSTAAMLNSPIGIYVDASYLWIAELTGRIRRVSLATQIITLFAGSGTGSYGNNVNALTVNLNSPAGITSTNNKIYFSEYYSSQVREISFYTNIVTTIAGGGGQSGSGIAATSCSITHPEGIAVKDYFVWFVTDTSVRRVYIRRPSVTGDPHFVGLSGGAFTIDLLPNRCYNIFNINKFDWISCTLQLGHRMNTYLGMTKFRLSEYEVVVSPNPKLISINSYVNGQFITNSFWSKKWNCWPNVICRIVITKHSVLIQSSCITIRVVLKGRTTVRMS